MKNALDFKAPFSCIVYVEIFLDFRTNEQYNV
jgi:hypothetical protein